MKWPALLFALAWAFAARSSDTTRVSDLAQHALEQSLLTLPGGRPFHLQAILVETTNPNSDYRAKIEEYWIAPDN